MKDYDIRSIFEQMELELISSMKRNLSRHQKWEKDEDMNWTMWQAEQLKTLEEFKKNNQKIFTKKFTSVNNEIAKFLESNYKTSGFAQERAILKELAKGNTFNPTVSKGLEGAFFSFNDDKMNALIKAATKDMSKAEHAMLRMVDDQYRRTIYKAQVMANSSAFTLQQSIDMATKDFLKAGINCIEYKDGRRVNIASYAEMNIRTATKRAKLISEGEARKAYGIHTVRVSRYGQCSETCLPWQGKVYVDDVYSGGTKEEAERLNLPVLSVAIAGDLFHPNCKHTMTTYFYDLKKSLGKLQEDGVENSLEEQEHRKNQKHIQQQERIATGSLDPLNIAQAEQRKMMWEEKDKKLLNRIPNNQNLDIVPKEFDFPLQKENRMLAIYTSIDKQFLNDGLEHMGVCDSISGKLLKPIYSSQSKNHVGLSNEYIDLFIKSKAKSLTTIHNHPKCTPFSITDIVTTNNFVSIKETLVINSKGEVYYLSIPKGKELDLSNDELIHNFSDDIMKLRKEYRKKYPELSKSDVNHLVYKDIFERLGWKYGRKRY